MTEIIEDVDVILCDNAAFLKYLEGKKIAQDIFVVSPDLSKNPESKHVHILVEEDADEENINHCGVQDDVPRTSNLSNSEINPRKRICPVEDDVPSIFNFGNSETSPRKRFCNFEDDVPSCSKSSNSDINSRKRPCHVEDDVPSCSNIVNSEINAQKKSWRQCVIETCVGVGKLNSFPKINVNSTGNNNLNFERCKKWLDYCVEKFNCQQLRHVQVTDVNYKLFLRDAHFSACQYFSQMKERLLPTAVPDVLPTQEDSVLVIGEEHDCANLSEETVARAQDINSSSTKCCSVVGCLSNNQKFHYYPSIYTKGVIKSQNVERLKQWIKSSGNIALLQIEAVVLHKRYYICADHFSKNQYNKSCSILKPKSQPDQNLGIILTDDVFVAFPVINSGASANHTGVIDDVHHDQSVIEQLMFDRLLTSDNIKDKYYKAFMKDMNDLKEYTCKDCHETFYTRRKWKNPCLHTKNCANYSVTNNMDPGEVPAELLGLSYIEEQLIALVHPILSVYKIRGHQFGYHGNVINFNQSVEEFAKKLPHNIHELSSVITVRTGATNDHEPQDFHVRSRRVFDALLWLKRNNIYYEHIEISQENLEILPDDGNVIQYLPSVNVEDSNVSHDHQDLSLDTHLIAESGVPVMPNANQDVQVQNVLSWPSISKEPINEFNTVGFIARAFPCLFPTGMADLRQPRNVKVDTSDYFKHLMRYSDKRFASHPRFRFFALNSSMRWTAIKKGTLYVERKSELVDLTADQLKEKIMENPRFLDSLMYQCSSIRGTKPYWKARSKELLKMIEQCGMPTLFFTLSAADLQWPGLFKLLAPDEDLTEMSDHRRRHLVQCNPLLVDKYFSERVCSFMQKVLKPKYNVKDYWYRVEYQHRGSPHIHGVLWLDGAPDLSNLENMSETELAKIVEYFNTLVVTENPNLNAPPAVVHPCRKDLEDVVDLKRDLAELLNRVQRHTKCTPNYCLKKPNNSGSGFIPPRQCRFRFPKELVEESTIKKNEKDEYEFISKRNDEKLNKYNPYMIMLWRANMDIAPVLSKRALVNYLAKYVAKCESKSLNFHNIVSDLCDKGDISIKSIIQKLYIKACSERDYSAQEVNHLLMSEKLISCSRSFVHIFISKNDDWLVVDTDEHRGKSILQKYAERLPNYDMKSLWCMAKNFNFSNKKLRINNPAIVVVCPKFNLKLLSDSNSQSNNELYYRSKVILHVPWRDLSQFKITDNISWHDLYLEHQQEIDAEDYEAISIPAEEEITSDDDNEFLDPSYDVSTEDYMVLSAMLPDQNTQRTSLGSRHIDVSYNWAAASDKYSQYGSWQELASFISEQKKHFQSEENIPPYPNVDFNDGQASVLALVDSQIDMIKSTCGPVNNIGKSVIVQGSAGTGKSLLIRALTNRVMTEFGEKSIMLLAPTGVAAVNISGSTIHSKLHISSINDFSDLEKEEGKEIL